MVRPRSSGEAARSCRGASGGHERAPWLSSWAQCRMMPAKSMHNGDLRSRAMLGSKYTSSSRACGGPTHPSLESLYSPGRRARRSDWPQGADGAGHVSSGDLPMAKGTVKWFNPTKGYGFIQPQGGGGKDVFVHISAVERAGLTTLNEGQVVEYEEVSNRGKTSAENLKVQH